MDWKRNYHRLWQYKKPFEKTHIRREMARFSLVCKMAIFGKIAKGDQRKIFKHGRFFGQTSEG